jgi:phosphoglucomutase
VTEWVERRADELLRKCNTGVKRVTISAAMNALRTHKVDFVLPYVQDLQNVVDVLAIRSAGLKLGVDPLGGAAEPYWGPINSTGWASLL